MWTPTALRYQGSMTNQPIVAVQGQAEIEVPPDFARLVVAAQVADRAREGTEQRLTQISHAVDQVIRQHAPALRHHTVSAFTITPIRSTPESLAPDRFDGHRNWTIEVAEVGVLAQLVADLGLADDLSLAGPFWLLAADSPAQQQARRAAVADAVLRARDYAAAFGAEIDALVEISDTGLDAGPSPMFAMRDSSGWGGESGGAGMIDLTPQPQQVVGSVRARFTMTPPDLDAPLRP